jgi:hypothetical protein
MSLTIITILLVNTFELGALSLDGWSDVSHYHHLHAQVYFFELWCPPINANLDGQKEVSHDHHHLCPSLLFLRCGAHLLTLNNNTSYVHIIDHKKDGQKYPTIIIIYEQVYFFIFGAHLLKVPKCEIFYLFDFNDFYGIKSV